MADPRFWQLVRVTTLYAAGSVFILTPLAFLMALALQIDGANRRQSFWHVTLPMLRPVVLFVVSQAIIGSYSLFAQP